MLAVRVLAVQPGQRDHHVQPVVGKPSTRLTLRNLLSPPTVQFGIRGIAQPQLDSGPDLILERGANLGPSRRGQHDMHTE